jgi:CRP-like cAMP-binding protein
MPWQRMHQMLASEPHLQQIFLEKVAFDFRQAQARIMVLGQQNIYQRLASFILEFLYHSEYFDPKTSRLKLPVNRFDIADYLGTAPESAARAFARLEAEGLVKRVTSRTVDILDLDGLIEMQRGRRRSHNKPTAVDA